MERRVICTSSSCPQVHIPGLLLEIIVVYSNDTAKHDIDATHSVLGLQQSSEAQYCRKGVLFWIAADPIEARYVIARYRLSTRLWAS